MHSMLIQFRFREETLQILQLQLRQYYRTMHAAPQRMSMHLFMNETEKSGKQLVDEFQRI